MFIPFRIRMMHLFGRTSFIMGFLFAFIGLVFICFFGARINWRLYFAGEDDLVLTQAVITGFQETRYEVNDVPLFNYNYRYSDGSDSTYSGNLLEFEEALSIGQEVEIAYLKLSPSLSRFTGKDKRNFDKIMLLGSLGALLVGWLFMIPSSRRTRKERRILASGRPAEGKLLQAVPTTVKVNEQPVYNLTFEFHTGNNSPEQCTVRSHLIQNFSNDHKEKLIYDPRNPSNAVIIDTLPSSVARYILNKFPHSSN